MESGIIHRDTIRSVTTTSYRPGANSSEVITGFTAPVAATEYISWVYLYSVRNDRDWSDNDEVFSVTYQAPTSFTGITDPTDHMLQYFLNDLNSRSKIAGNSYESANKNVVGFAIDIDGGSTGQALGTIAVGTVIPVIVIDGVTYNYVADLDFVRTVGHWINDSSLTATSEIIPIDITTAGNAANTDAIVVMGLDYDLAAYTDDIEQVKTTVRTNLGNNFRATAEPTFVQVSADEGTGMGS